MGRGLRFGPDRHPAVEREQQLAAEYAHCQYDKQLTGTCEYRSYAMTANVG